jgi:hypothetical protein
MEEKKKEFLCSGEEFLGGPEWGMDIIQGKFVWLLWLFGHSFGDRV